MAETKKDYRRVHTKDPIRLGNYEIYFNVHTQKYHFIKRKYSKANNCYLCEVLGRYEYAKEAEEALRIQLIMEGGN